MQSKLIGRATQVVFVTENLAATYREWRGLGDHPWVRHEGVSVKVSRPSVFRDLVTRLPSTTM